ncbi:MAG: diguanylate cyclase, partial [Candidatus Krumholzibacteria bacterium]
MVLVVVAILAFGLMTDYLLRRQARSFLVEQARLCAAALVPGRDGDLTESVRRLRDRYDRLIAVATLDTSGHLHTVYPERPAHRMALLSVLEEGGSGRVAMRAPQGGEPLSVAGIVVPLNGSSSPAARKAVILFRNGSYRTDWLQAIVIFALLVGATALFSAHTMMRWFDRRVAGPLRNMAGAVRDPLRGRDEAPTLEPGDWCETTQLAEQIRELVRSTTEMYAYTRCLERETQYRIRARQIGFDRKLRRIKDQATIDAITGLRNRSFLEEELEPLFARYHAGHKDLSAVMIDVDNFKRYNDTHGHQVGDALLEFVGALLRSGTRRADHA